jgi:hypothetical protein
MARSLVRTAFIAGVWALAITLLTLANVSAQPLGAIDDVDAAIARGYNVADDIDVASGDRLESGLYHKGSSQWDKLDELYKRAKENNQSELADRLDGVLTYLGDSLEDAWEYGEGYYYEGPLRVKICSLYGAGFYYVPGTDACIKVGGFVRLEGGLNISDIRNGTFSGIDVGLGGKTNTFYTPSQTTAGQFGVTADVFRVYFNSGPKIDVRQQTEYETLRSYISLRTGFIESFGGKAKYSGSDLNAIPQGSVDGYDQLRWTVPVMGVYGFPASSYGLNIPNLTTEIFGGFNINNRKTTYTVTEFGAPGKPSFSVSDTWTSVDPAVGIGLQYSIGTYGGHPISIGASATFDWTKSHSVALQSPDFVTEHYQHDTGRRMETSIHFNVGIDLW